MSSNPSLRQPRQMPAEAEQGFLQVQTLQRIGKLEKAEVLLIALLEEYPDAPVGWYQWLIAMSNKLKHWSVVQSAYQQLLIIENRAEWWFSLGGAQEKIQLWEEAKQSYLKALEEHYVNAKVYYRLGLVYNMLGMHRDSLLNYQRALPFFASEESFSISSATFYFEWINTLIKCDFYKDALLLLLKALGQVISGHASFEKLIRKLFMLLPQQGLLKEGLFGLILLRQHSALQAVSTELYLDICVRYGFFEEEAIWLSEHVLENTHTFDPALKHAFYLHLIYFGFNEALVARVTALCATKDLDKKLLLTLAAALFQHQRYDQLSILLARVPTEQLDLSEYVADVPCVAWYVLQQSNIAAEVISLAQDTLNSYQQVVECQSLVWQKLYAAPDVAIVGNSSCDVGKSQGQQIDQHGFVVRFNNFLTEPPYDTDYGSKVNLHIRPGADVEKYEITEPEVDIVLSGIQPWLFYHKWSTITRILAKGTRVAFFPEKEQTLLLQQVKRAPSAGLTAVWICSQQRSMDTTDCYGFQFIDQCGENAKSAHYWEDSKPSPRHEWEKELPIFNRITRKPLPALRLEPQRLKIKLTGDHSAYHGGCGAVVQYLTDELERAGRLVSHEDYDILIVNGEGSMHHSANNFYRKMNLLGQAIGRRKPAYLINSVWQDNNVAYSEVIARQTTQVILRENASQQDFNVHLKAPTAVRLDVSYWAAVDELAEFSDYEQNVVVSDFYSHEFGNFVRLTEGFLSRYRYFEMKNLGWSSIVKSLRTASLLVTGRHHAVFAACRAKTPFVALKGNTHKIEGFIQMSGLPIPVCDNPLQLLDAIKWAQQNTAVYEEFFAWMETQPRFTIEDLGLKPIQENG